MVFKEEIYQSKQEVSDKHYRFKKNIKSSPLLDRIGSFVVDYFVIFFPIATLLTATVQKELKIHTLLQNEQGIYLIYIQYVLSFFVISIFYNTVLTYTLGATFGQKFFNLKIGSIEENQTLGLYQSFVRALTLSFTLFFAGIPFLFYFTHNGRRTIHDLVSDTYVFKKGMKTKNLNRSTVVLGRSLSVLFAVLAFVLVFSASKSVLKQTQIDISSYKEAPAVSGCEAVESKLSSWPEPLSGVPQRLEMAMSLYAIEEIEVDCLKKEANLVFESGEETALAYLALSFVYSDQPSRSDSYLDKVCSYSMESESCKMAKVIEYWSDDRVLQVESIFDSMPESSTYFKLWQARFFMTEQKIRQAWSVLDQLPKVKSISSFASFSKVKTLWQMGKEDESRLVADSIYEREDDFESNRLAHWQCFEELDSGCDVASSWSCNRVKSGLKIEGAKADIATYKSMLCDNSLSLSAKYSWDSDVKKLLDLNFSTLDAPRLTTFLKNEFTDWRVPYTAITEYIKKVSYVEASLFESLVDWTVSIPNSFEKKKLVGKIFNFFYEKKEFEYATAYGETYFDENISKEQTKAMVVSAFKAGLMQKAQAYLKKIERSEGTYRGLASQSDFEFVKNKIKKGN